MTDWHEIPAADAPAHDASGVPILRTVGGNCFGRWNKSNTACRAIVLDGDRLLLSYEQVTDQWMLPGGGLERGESERDCCVREVMEETGYLVSPSDCVLQIEEYYENWKYVSRYFTAEVTGQAQQRLTEREREVGMIPRWLPLGEIMEIFSRHADWADTDEMRRGIYLREYTALCALGFGSQQQ
ncbi:MAG: NUDIX domain-containing protein [Clostridia bacterium]|nr:NUDIX domain-containing protein [Clostridia bacterium]